MQRFNPFTATVLAISLSCAASASPASAGAGGGRFGGGAAARPAGGGEFFGGAERHFDAGPPGPGLAGHGPSHGDDRARIRAVGADPTEADDRDRNLRAAVARRLLNSHAMASAPHDTVAIAGRYDRDEHGWWRHRHRALFWLFNHDDAYDYAAGGDDSALLDYGYDDIYGEIFAPYRHGDRIGELPPGESAARTRQASRMTADPLAPPAAADRAASLATVHPATSKAATPPPKSQAAVRPTPSKTATQSTMSQAAAPPTASKPTAPPAMAQAAAPAAVSKPTAPPTMAQAAAPPAAPKPTAPPAMAQAAAPPTEPQPPRRVAANHPAQMCSEDSHDIAGLPIDQIQRAIAPNEAQVAALDELGNASMKAAQDIRAACPKQIAAAAPARLATMQQRVEAMIAGVVTVRPALDKFYGLLDDGQKARLNGIGPNQPGRLAAQRSDSLVQNCGSAQVGATDWPIAEIEARLQLSAAQRESLTALVEASAKASDMFKEACRPDAMLTPPARLAAIGNRLDVMLLAIKTVLAALDDFYGQLTEEQKTEFEAIGPSHAAASAGQAEAGEPAASARRYRGRPRASIGGGAI